MNNKTESNHMIDLLFTLALFCVFAASALFVVIIGARVYQTTVKQMNDNYTTRTSLSYIAEKIRQNDTAGSVELGMIENTQALILMQNYDGMQLRTYIYQDEGMIKELFIKGSDTPVLANGQTIMAIQELDMEKIGPSLYHFTSIDENNQPAELYLSPKAEQEADNE